VNFPVTTWGDDTVDTISLHTDVWGVPLRVDILQRVVRWQLAKRRRGTAKAKTRAEVSGGGRKPRPQKGQGASRQGSIRAPQWRGGGRVFPPRPRSFAFRIPKHVRRLALRVALATKYAQVTIFIIFFFIRTICKTLQLRTSLGTIDYRRQCGPSYS
jgi:large subunit ribosomal protein L4